MRITKWIILITGFLVVNTYYEGKYTDILLKGKKYYTMILYGFIGLSVYMFLKKHPSEGKNMFLHANSLIKYMPIDKGAGEILTPFMDFTNIQETFQKMQPSNPYVLPHLANTNNNLQPQMKRMLNSGMNNVKNKRSVSESKKKYIASQQGWKCAMCSNILDATYEVDHKVELQYGGSNHVSNLAALCPNCHRRKTLENNM